MEPNIEATGLRCTLRGTSGTPVPLVSVAVNGEVVAGRARIVLRQCYRNAEHRNVEAVYTFPVPADSAVTGFSMTCRGRRLEAIVKERDEAFREYDDAVTRGHGAALLDRERGNVFTAAVGNLLPDEDVDVEIEYVQVLRAQDGCLRVMIPSLVAPRYVPGVPDDTKRTADGWADPTDRVPDADRVTPPVGDAPYGLSLDLAFRMGGALQVESPSHDVIVTREDGVARVHLTADAGETGRIVPLDRDIVLVARNVAGGSMAVAECHRVAGERGTVAITIVPDLFDPSRRAGPLRATFVVDTSGSMGGASIAQAQDAVLCCLRHLREGDAFNVIAFGSRWQSLAPHLVPFTDATLRDADAFVRGLRAAGGTEMLAPLTHAMAEAPDGLIVLLTDGQVANEREILEAVLAARGDASTRVLAFGIGTTVSDELLRALARRTDGAVEFIHPGERIDEKVIAQFARATAGRVTDVSVSVDGVTLEELAPAQPASLVDGEPWVLFGRYAAAGRGVMRLAGKRDGAPFAIEVPVTLPETATIPALPKLWAAERIRDLTESAVGRRRERSLRERIVKLAVETGVASEYTSFVVIETREGDRVAAGQPVTRVVPVSAPAGWAMFERPGDLAGGRALRVAAGTASWMADACDLGIVSERRGHGGTRGSGAHDFVAFSPPAGDEVAFPGVHCDRRDAAFDMSGPCDAAVAILHDQLASGLWPDDASRPSAEATVRALRALMAEGVTAAHPLHGAQVAKAVDALLPLCGRLDATETALALAVAWLSSRPRLRARIAELAATLPAGAGIASRMRAGEREVRAWLDAMP